MKFAIRRTAQMKKDVKRLARGGKDLEKLLTVIGILADGKPMQPEWRDHPLGGNFKGKRDCHIEPDWILIYAIEDDELVLYRTGSHSELFG